MSWFGRRNEGLEEERFVETESGWRPLKDVVEERWPNLAGSAWVFYQQHGRGAVVADFAADQLHYAIADAMRGDPELRRDPFWLGVFDLCRRYNPKRDVVLVVWVVPPHGRESDARLFASGMSARRGTLSPPEAAAFMQRAEEQHGLWESIRAQIGDLDTDAEERRGKALDPDSV